MKHLRHLLVAGLLGLTALFVSGPFTSGQEKKSEVKVEATAEKPDAAGNQVILITLDIEKGWHTYANPVENESLTDAQTIVKITGKTPPEKVGTEYPAGKLKVDPVGDFRIYEGKVTIKAMVTRAKGDTDPLQVTVKYQVCNDKTCKPPATVKLEVK
jgi:DsbC/DsbD-like thiol-disulfide interchange protein